jgi:actin-related protein 8
MRLNKRNIENFNCILVIPDIFVKHHLRYIVSMILTKMKFKSLFMHTESVMATFAMAMSTACIVDIGSSKISVCCIDEGLLVPKSI